MALGSLEIRARALTSVEAGLGMQASWMEIAGAWLCGVGYSLAKQHQGSLQPKFYYLLIL